MTGNKKKMKRSDRGRKKTIRNEGKRNGTKKMKGNERETK